jgi:RNA polymerase sigma factor (sigma-70 family)
MRPCHLAGAAVLEDEPPERCVRASVSHDVPDDVATLYIQYGASVVRRASQILRNADDAQEVLQDVFARLLARPELVNEARDPAAFLYAVTTSACLNRLRDRRNRARLVEREVVPWQRDHAPGSSQDRALVLDLLVKLPEDQASAAIYHYLDGMSHQEIAEVLGCSRRHVGNLIERVQVRVRQLVDEAI